MDVHTKNNTVSGIVLAGGISRRLGRNKALESIGGEPLIARVIGRLSEIAGATVVVVADMDQAARLPLPERSTVTEDVYPGKGSLGGIFSGLRQATSPWSMVVACDMPFLNLDLIRYMLSLREGQDVVVPLAEGRPEPTHALYSKSCLPFIDDQLESGDLKIARFYDKVDVRYVSEEETARFDPDHLSFFNVNTQEDLDRSLALVDQGR